MTLTIKTSVQTSQINLMAKHCSWRVTPTVPTKTVCHAKVTNKKNCAKLERTNRQRSPEVQNMTPTIYAGWPGLVSNSGQLHIISQKLMVVETCASLQKVWQ